MGKKIKVNIKVNKMSNSNTMYNSPNMQIHSVSDQLKTDQQPLGSQFKSYELNKAVNHYLLDPFQYSITKFQYYLPCGEATNQSTGVSSKDFKNDPGLIYKNINFEKLLPTFTSEKKSAKDLRAVDYHRFEANEGYFNPKEAVSNTDLWYYGANDIARKSPFKIAGKPLNVQEIKHIIFPEPERGGTNTQLLTRYSWSPVYSKKDEGDDLSWESSNDQSVNNNENCKFFNYNSRYSDAFDDSFNKVYSFDSNYCRNIGISSRTQGVMPYPEN